MPKKLASTDYYSTLKDPDVASKMRHYEQPIRRAWTKFAASGIELGEILREAREVLAIAGCEGKFSGWLRHIGIPRNTAYAHITFLEGCEVLGVEAKETALAMQTVKLLAAPETPPEVVKKAKRADKSGQVITANIVKEWIGNDAEKHDPTDFDHWQEVCEHAARSVKKTSKDIEDNPWTTSDTMGHLSAQLSNAAQTIRSVKPAGTCPACEGDGCKQCRKTGWLPKLELDSVAVPF